MNNYNILKKYIKNNSEIILIVLGTILSIIYEFFTKEAKILGSYNIYYGWRT